MRTFVKDRVLHVVFSGKRVPLRLNEVATLYEGPMRGRIGVNVPMHVVRHHWPDHPLCSDAADYIIGYPDWDATIRKHEQLHARFFFDQQYRVQVKALWKGMCPAYRAAVHAKLQSWGYPSHVFLDEWQAYTEIRGWLSYCC